MLLSSWFLLLASASSFVCCGATVRILQRMEVTTVFQFAAAKSEAHGDLYGAADKVDRCLSTSNGKKKKSKPKKRLCGRKIDCTELEADWDEVGTNVFDPTFAAVVNAFILAVKDANDMLVRSTTRQLLMKLAAMFDSGDSFSLEQEEFLMTANIVARDVIASTLFKQGESLSRAERDSRFTEYMDFEDLDFHFEQQQRKQLMYSFGVAAYYRGVELLSVTGEDRRSRRGRHKKQTMLTDVEPNKEQVHMEEIPEKETEAFDAQPAVENIERTGSTTMAQEALRQMKKWEAKLAAQTKARMELDAAIARSGVECAKWRQKFVAEKQHMGGPCF